MDEEATGRHCIGLSLRCRLNERDAHHVRDIDNYQGEIMHTGIGRQVVFPHPR
jgi:hypothetical protein